MPLRGYERWHLWCSLTLFALLVWFGFLLVAFGAPWAAKQPRGVGNDAQPNPAHEGKATGGMLDHTVRQGRRRMAKKLEGKIAVITGGSSGIGLASARLFVGEGAYRLV